jgi:hypothetical protein
MNNIDNFKEFVRKKPILISHVNNGTMTWQKFYELYSLYGEDENTWREYTDINDNRGDLSKVGLNDMLNWVKKFDLNSIQNGVNNIQRVIGVLQDLSSSNRSNDVKSEYKPRPLYRHFED